MRLFCTRLKLSHLLNTILIILVIYFIAHFIKSQWAQISGIHVSVNFPLLLVTLIIFEIYWLCQVLNWQNVMRQQGVKLSFINACYFYLINCLLAYIPGKIGNVVGMASLANQYNISKTKTITTVFLMQIYALISGALLICLTQFWLNANVKAVFYPFLPFILIGLVTALILISPKLIASTQKLASRLLKKEFSTIRFQYRHHLLNILIFAACWCILSVSLWLLMRSFDPTLSIRLYPDIMAIFLASYLVGLLAITLPSGLGIVELGLSYGYHLICNPTIALIGAIGFRLLNLTTLALSLLCIMKIKYYMKLKAGTVK